MKGGQMSKAVLQRTWIFVALLTVFQPSLAVKLPPLEELHALTDFAKANGIRQISSPAGGLLNNWNISWDRQGNWAGGNPCSQFGGIVCWSTGSLMMAKLSNSGLRGPISPALGEMTTVNTLFLSENELSGEVGPIIANLTWMRRLKLDGNNFTGSISSWVQNMHDLSELILARNSFVGDVPPGVFTKLNNLTNVDISNNSLSGPIPDDLGSLPLLQNLSLGANNFIGALPEFVSNSSTLRTVDLSHNFLKGQLPAVWNTSKLISLDLSGNMLSGHLPPQLLSLTSITHLNLAQNNFVGIVSGLQIRKFGCSAFADNPGLVLLDPRCVKLPFPKPFSGSPTPLFLPSPKNKGFSTLTIVALTVADIAFIFMSAVACVLFFIWWKKSKDNVKVGTSWPDSSSKDGSKDDGSSKDSSVSSAGGTITGPRQNMVLPKSSCLAAKSDVKPALKSVVGTIRAPTHDSMSTDHESFDQSFSSLDYSFSFNDLGANLVILDSTLLLEFEDLLSAKALVLGAGSFGVVYMACLEDGHILAIKRIEELALADRRAFGKQCAQLAELLHPNLLQLRAYCWSIHEKLLIFDYMRNGSVYSLIHEGRGSISPVRDIDWATRLKIAVGTARALAHLHDSDMVHGNIKASNVLLDDQFEPRVSDFGLETLMHKHSQAQHISANDGYIAPELVSGRTRRRTQDGDVYSLGVLLLELLTGREPQGDYSGGLPGWVQEMTSENRTMEILDPALVSMSVFPSAQDILEYLGLARACVSHDATSRPSITIVLRSLESIVPGSTAPRSYVKKHESIDSDASYPDGPHNPFSYGYDVIPVKDDDYHGGSF